MSGKVVKAAMPVLNNEGDKCFEIFFKGVHKERGNNEDEEVELKGDPYTLSSITSTLTVNTEIEIMDAFRGQNLTTDDTLQRQRPAEGTKLVKTHYNSQEK
ncbi:hypothetical protein F2P81_009546 [Scophthalmus maximus]|uniref:Uncharacterized protein n=1 Tax=Scophthalmus maximus TaxID=52904 RepID=A0A6A4TA92_SCOMX|nr:hypothetical protein F2P81_009546 [Scophthalmus maximus]